MIPDPTESAAGVTRPPTGVVVADFKNWHAVYTRSRHEKDVSSQLMNVGIECFLPAVTRDMRWRDRIKKVDFPLFPGYVFIREDFSGEYGYGKAAAICRFKGVVKILGDGVNGPTPIPDQEIFNIRTVIERKLKIDPYSFDFEIGQNVRIRKGPLAGVEGVLIRKRRHRELILKVNLVKQAVMVTIRTADVEGSL